MPNGAQPQAQESMSQRLVNGPVGAALVLVFLPVVALYFIANTIDSIPVIGLATLAIFGIMILFGTLALVATLYSRLGLQDKEQALALPEGSVRAAIALSLIVLFAIISIMLYQSSTNPYAKPYEIPVFGETNKAALVREFANRVIAVVPVGCVRPGEAAGTAERAGKGDAAAKAESAAKADAAAGSGVAGTVAGCPPESIRFSVHVVQPAGTEASDLAKQLLVLIGTLMTAVTSFYFASRAAAPTPPQTTPEAVAPTAPAAPATVAAPGASNGHVEAEGQVDGCDVPITDATADKDLPAAEGGVQK